MAGRKRERRRPGLGFAELWWGTGEAAGRVEEEESIGAGEIAAAGTRDGMFKRRSGGE